MNGWIENTHDNLHLEPSLYAAVEFQEGGDETIYLGVCIRPRKLWIEHIPTRHIADENSIKRWRVLVGEVITRSMTEAYWAENLLKRPSSDFSIDTTVE